MKGLITLLLLSIFSFVSAQEQTTLNDTTMFIGKISNDYVFIRKSIESAAVLEETLNSDDIVFVHSYEKSRYFGGLYGIFKDTINGYIKETDLFIGQDVKDYLIANEGFNEERFKTAQRHSKIYYLYKLQEELKLYESYQKIGLVITNKKYSYADYGSSFGLKLSFYNGYKKAIKYIEVTVRPYNRVGDKTYDDLGRDVSRVKVIGPLKPDHTAGVDFDDMFWDDRDVISYLVITYMKVTFMDGTTTEIKDIKKHLDKDVYNGKGE